VTAPASLHSGLRYSVFALLCGDTAYYLYAGPPSKALDAAAWLVLLALYTLETQHANIITSPHAVRALRAMRIVVASAVCAAGVAYLLERNLLDTVNTALWIAVVALLEFEVRYPIAIARDRRIFAITAVTLYAGLAALVAAWAWLGAWFDAYDALLWLIAFATIELDVLTPPRTVSTA
jgi:hypothetical protein